MIKSTLKTHWKYDVGAGYSNVCIKGKLLYTMGNKNKTDTVYCLDRETGNVCWEFSYPCPTRGYYPGTRSTPVFDESRLYTVSREGHVFCLNGVNGAVLWKRHLVKEFLARIPVWGFAGSPVIRENILYLNACRYGIALNKYTGEKIWASPGGKCGYATPVFCTLEGRETVLIFSHNALFALDPVPGRVLWKFPWETEWGANTADPLVFGNRIVISSSYGMGSICLEIKNSTPAVCWTSEEMSSHFPNFIYQKGCIYGNDGTAGKGRFCCIDPETGNVLWSKSPGFGTLTATEKYLILLTETGGLSVLETDGPGYREIAGTRIKGGIFFTEPVLCGGFLFIRERRGTLFCIDVRL
jgi:outer membrane protein assembly factor BamB